MLSRNEIERLAASISALRPDWPTASLVTFITKRDTRPLLDLTVELAWVAQLPDTKSPARIDEDGPWKGAIRHQVNTSDILGSPDFVNGCRDCGQPRDGHWSPDHSFQRPLPPSPMPDELRQMLKQPIEENA